MGYLSFCFVHNVFKMAQNSREAELIYSVLLSCSHKNDCSVDNNKLLFFLFLFFEFLELR